MRREMMPHERQELRSAFWVPEMKLMTPPLLPLSNLVMGTLLGMQQPPFLATSQVKNGHPQC